MLDIIGDSRPERRADNSAKWKGSHRSWSQNRDRKIFSDAAISMKSGLLETHGIVASMSRIGNPYDNAKAESFMKTLKHEEINGSSYRNLSQARSALGAFIETVYNRQRLHSALDYRSPDEYEATLAGFPGVASLPEVSITEICY